MQNKVIIGTDVSKLSLDNAIKTAQAHCRVANTSKGFKQWLTWALSFGKKAELHVVMEHTGYYSYQFELFLQAQKIAYTKVNALEIKRSSGLVRGKNDKTDAMMISLYGWLRREQLKADTIPAAVITELKDFISLRDKLVRDRSGYKARVKEQNATRKYAKSHLQNRIQMRKIKELTEDIKEVEKAMKQLLKQHTELQKNYDLMVSIKGIGFVIAAYMLAYTDNFAKFSDSSKFNCYAGLVPFEHTSGTSIRGKSRVSHFANKKAKRLLNLAASVAIQHNQELKQYYQRRVAEGKSKIGTLNIIRKKLVDRMFAIIKRQTPYQPNLNIAA